MNRRRKNSLFPPAFFALAVLLFSCPAAPAADSAPPAQPAQPQGRGYEAYKLVRTRNIFDPERRPIRTESPRSTAPISRADSVMLTGTMVTAGKRLAFFSGSRGDFNKVLPVQEKIAEYTVAAIETTHVDLQKDGKTTVVAVGKPVPIEGRSATSAPGSTPDASAASAPADAPAAPESTAPVAPTAPASDSSAPPDKNELIRRMMERRQKEVSQ